MKGLIFNALAELVEDNYGIAVWNKVLASIDSVVDGAYVGPDSYPAEEMQQLVMALTAELGAPPATLLDVFGQKLFGDLYALYPELVDSHSELVPFITSVDTVIHEEMKIMHVDAEVPTMTFKVHDRKLVRFEYRSPRRLCMLAEGLVRGAARHFSTEVELEQVNCMHDGAIACEFELRIIS